MEVQVDWKFFSKLSTVFIGALELVARVGSTDLPGLCGIGVGADHTELIVF
jgi:hypothetical protein